MSYDEANDVLQGGGAPVAKFPLGKFGHTVKGTVVEAKVTQQTDLKGVPKTFASGDPMKQIVLTIQTEERDPEITDDDGQRRVFIKGQMVAAVRTAIQAAGAKGLDTGGSIAIQYTSDKASETVGFSPAKQYVAQYKAPVATGVSEADLLD